MGRRETTMRFRTGSLVLLAALVVASQPVLAAETSTKPGAPAVTSAPAPASVKAPTVPSRPQGEFDDDLLRAEWLLVHVALRSDRIHKWLRRARQRSAFRRARCIDRILTQAHAVERQGQEARRQAQRAAKRGQRHEFAQPMARLWVCSQRSRALIRIAHACSANGGRPKHHPSTYRLRIIKPPSHTARGAGTARSVVRRANVSKR